MKFIAYSYTVLTIMMWFSQLALYWLWYWHSVLQHPMDSRSNEQTSLNVLALFSFASLFGAFLICTDIVVSFHYRKYLFHHWRATILIVSFIIIREITGSSTAGGWYLNYF
jgi:hypothetical protein